MAAAMAAAIAIGAYIGSCRAGVMGVVGGDHVIT